MAKWLLVNSDILILDEPTRGIDIGAREEIYQIIYEMAKEGKTVIVISSDLPEILKICPRILVMYEGSLMGELNGDECTEESIIAMASGLQIQQKTARESSTYEKGTQMMISFPLEYRIIQKNSDAIKESDEIRNFYFAMRPYGADLL